MPVIQLQTVIKAPQNIVFDLNRSIDLHRDSMKHHEEEVISGISTGLLGKDDVVVWKAKHLLQNRKLQIKITQLQSPEFFADEMVEGAFTYLRHEHYFASVSGNTIMTDRFYFESPFGILGKFVNWLILENYMEKLLLKRNAEIKRIAESDLRKQYLHYD